MRENRTHGSEGGEGDLPDPYHVLLRPAASTPPILRRSNRSGIDGRIKPVHNTGFWCGVLAELIASSLRVRLPEFD